MIESVFRVRCSGNCGRYLASVGGTWAAVAVDMRELFDSRDAAYQAAQDAGWRDCGEHAGHLLFPGDDPACLTTCPDCRAKLAEFEELLSRSSLGTPTAHAIAALTTDEDVADIWARLNDRRKENHQ